MLCLLRRRVDEASRCHLFGVVPESRLLPLYLPHKRRTLRAKPSEMSFKCRSSVSIASQVAALPKDNGLASASLESLVPARPQGLGIHTSRASAPASLLQPRPSLSSIRSHASLPLPFPPASPLPPLPAYLPAAIRATSAMHKAIYTPISCSHPIPTRSNESLRRLQPPAPVLSRENLAVLARRPTSASSTYSRDTTGGDSEVIPSMDSRPSLTSSSSSSSVTTINSIVTIKRSPLHMMTLPEGSPEEHTSKMSDASSESSRGRARSLGSSIESIEPLRIRKSSMPNKLEEKLRRYAESQSRIREMGYKPLMQDTMGCPERFRFE